MAATTSRPPEVLSQEKYYISVADPVHVPDFYPSRIPGPKTAQKEEGEVFLLSYHFL
jgi:hypothetical protein